MNTIEEIDGIECSPCLRNDRIGFSLLIGQLLSLCLCGTGITSQLLSDRYFVNTPTTQAFLNYFLLCLVYGTMLACKSPNSASGGLIEVFKTHWWKYFILSFIDVEANYLMVKAYQYTDLASIQLLDSFTIPVVLFLSFCFLNVRYMTSHVLGVTICLIGIGCLVWGDVINGKSGGASNRLIGDLLCLAGAMLYGISNIVEEVLVKRFSRTEYLGMMGIFGSFISGIQLAITEREALTAVEWQKTEIILLYIGFAICMFVFYSFATLLLQKTSAAMYNLSILTADFYTFLAGLFIFGLTFHYLYCASFVCVLVGSIVYSLKPTRRRDSDDDQNLPPLPAIDNFLSINQSIIPPAPPRALFDEEKFAENSMTDGVTVHMCHLHGPVLLKAKSLTHGDDVV